MSYEIVYNKQFLKIDGKIIPLVLHGSNNCYESLYNGRQRRDRNWNPFYIGSNKQIALLETDLIKMVESLCDGGEYQEHFMQNGKLIDDKGLIRFFQNGIKNAKTIEKLKEDYFFMGMHGYFSIWKGMDNTIENRVEINSSDDLREFLDTAQNRIDNRAEKEGIYVCLNYYNEKFECRVKPESIKDLLEDAEWIENKLLEVGEALNNLGEESGSMDREQFYNYILENFTISGEAGRLIDNILQFVESHYPEENEQYNALCSLLDGTIGLTNNEIKKVYM